MNLNSVTVLLAIILPLSACRRESATQTANDPRRTPQTAYGVAVNQAKALSEVSSEHSRVLEEESLE